VLPSSVGVQRKPYLDGGGRTNKAYEEAENVKLIEVDPSKTFKVGGEL